MTPTPSPGATKLAIRIKQARQALRPPPRLNLIEWADTYRQVSAKTSASPGRWKTSSQPVAFGPFGAVTESDTHTVTVMAGTQVVKTELDINVALYFIHQDPSPILFVQPTQGAAESFSKERVEPTIEASPAIREALAPYAGRSTITHKEFKGGSIDFVGSNSPTDLASRPKRVIICDEIDKYPPSAGKEGDPLILAEERASTYRALGRGKFVRTCSPTDEDTSRIGREYQASDRRKCFVTCPHCAHAFTIAWKDVHWSKDEAGEHRPDTAGVICPGCGVFWSEGDRIRALDALEHAPGYGWRQTRPFSCCGERQEPALWDNQGRSLCRHCQQRAPYDGHAGFQISKLFSKRHRLADLVREFLLAVGDPELLKKFTNTALAELWRPAGRESFDGSGLIARAEAYGPQDLPAAVKVITSFTDVQGDRLETQFIGWGEDEEAWPFLYQVIHQDPAQPAAWRELDSALLQMFRTVDGRTLRVAAAGIDAGGHHGAQVFAFARRRAKRRIFATYGRAGARPIWPTAARKTKLGEQFWPIGVDTAKDAIFGRLKIEAPAEGGRKPGLIHFPAADGFGPDYFEQLTSERRELRKRLGRAYAVWVLPEGKRNEALDTFVGALAVRKSLPRRIDASLQYDLSPPADEAPAEPTPEPAPAPAAPAAPKPWIDTSRGWL
ncbi:terminase [Kaistia sp. 32K]|uniref:phage terminase large subunit family protein n=1 Tax=Kaistia sp. 32K TaxID=2795690 RepID=UPI001916681C|nr:terminase gpA endonuclease subunit [Kaistia sp. 32K]BCP53793.1 terminase [Kaistia sp. 32K]